MSLVLAILLGGAFGFVLHKVGASNPQRIIGMLRLRDLHLMKVILLGIGSASAGLFLLMAVGAIPVDHLSVKAAHVGVLIGGALLGIGFAVAGYCPGTGVCALGAGRRDAISFVLGGLVGALLFTLVYGAISGSWAMADLAGKATLAETGREGYASVVALPGLLVAGLTALALIVIAVMLPAGRDASSVDQA